MVERERMPSAPFIPIPIGDSLNNKPPSEQSPPVTNGNLNHSNGGEEPTDESGSEVSDEEEEDSSDEGSEEEEPESDESDDEQHSAEMSRQISTSTELKSSLPPTNGTNRAERETLIANSDYIYISLDNDKGDQHILGDLFHAVQLGKPVYMEGHIPPCIANKVNQPSVLVSRKRKLEVMLRDEFLENSLKAKIYMINDTAKATAKPPFFSKKPKTEEHSAEYA
ncbi:hypothetical protein HK097_008614 [Rhizophlyctis rosea]|uniref:Uncharacterized protein n=1 Tax=Rhizophlyctis rosea TaxID=64517 RepID=A0AAD5SA38_9FUNG|nr:hypothetical protein HK097_008614 [Rhizophlyctis rosea]